MPLHIDTAAAIRRPTDQAALVQAVLAADRTDETHWLEWKSRLDLTAVEGRFTVAKAILGLSNRHPDHAARAMQGNGYLMIGVEPASPTVAVCCVVAGSGRVERWLDGVVARPTSPA